MRKIPKKNYIIFLLMIVAVVVIVFYLCNAYNFRMNYKYVSPMNSFITEIKVDDIENYIVENSLVVIYVSNKKDDTLKEREEKFKKLLTKYNIHQYFVYLDMSLDTELISKTFEDKYKNKLDYDRLPILFVMIDGKIVDVYYEEIYDTAKVTDFLKENDVIENK